MQDWRGFTDLEKRNLTLIKVRHTWRPFDFVKMYLNAFKMLEKPLNTIKICCYLEKTKEDI
jgi:hypothetical protein